MATSTIKNIPNPLVENLKNQAATYGRSFNQEIIRCLKQAAQNVPLDPETILARARAIRKMPAKTRLTDRRLDGLKAEGRP